MKNILIQEFQHSLELRLIEVMKIEMLQIQFVSNMNLIQRKSIEVGNDLSEKQLSSESRNEKSIHQKVQKVKQSQLNHFEQQLDVHTILLSLIDKFFVSLQKTAT
jgi:arginine utilization protein RocB